jgi:outer membrane autotransporter protein
LVDPKGGATKTEILNAGGEGALTEGDGILVVQVLDPAGSASGTLTLANDVEAGPFDHRLFQGGVGSDNPGDWFLRSDFVVTPKPEPPEPTEPPGKPEPEPPQPPKTGPPPFPSLPPADPLPPGVYPIIEPRLATDGVVQPITRQLGLTMLGTLHQRIGDTLTEDNADMSGRGWGHSAWARVFGDQIDNSYQAFANPNVDGRIIGVQAGLDIWRGSLIQGHRDAAGLYFA